MISCALKVVMAGETVSERTGEKAPKVGSKGDSLIVGRADRTGMAVVAGWVSMRSFSSLADSSL